MTFLDELKRRNVLRVAAAYVVSAWLIIQVVETILPQYGLERHVQTVITLLAIGFVPALVLAWVLEWTPRGIRVDHGSEAADNSAAAVRASRRFDRIVIVILTVALAWFVYDKLVPPAPQVDYSIAVLPFNNESPEEMPDYLADGLAGEVRELLAKQPQLLVIERSAAFSFRGQNLAVTDIGERLGVSHLLTGAVTQLGDRIRVRARLLHAADGEALWSRDYTGTLSDIFTIQSEIAADVSASLEIHTSGSLPESQQTTFDVAALTLQAKQLWYEKLSQPDAEAMLALLGEALEIDPTYTPAMVWSVYANYVAREQGLISAAEENERWLKLAGRILAQEPDNGDVHNLFAWGALRIDRDPQAAALSYARALQSAPNNADILQQAARFAMIIGHEEDAIAIIERSMSVDPLCSVCLYQASRIHLYAGRYDKAEALLERFIARYGQGHYQKGIIQLLQGNAGEALTLFQELEAHNAAENPDSVGAAYAGFAMAFHELGRHGESDEFLSAYIEKFGEQFPLEVARAYAWRNDKDEAFDWLQQASRADPYGEPIMGVDPLFTNLHDDPRWEATLAAHGLSTAQLAALEFPVELLTRYRDE
jgi:TolB-like protein/tetratricopeptide (TPR) repeat protein